MSDMIDHLHDLGYEAIHPDTPLPPGYVDSLEDALGCELPDDYREFIREFPLSGGCDAPLIRLREEELGSEAPELSWLTLLGYEAPPNAGLVGTNTGYPDHQVEDMIIIGDDIAGNFLYMGVNGRPGIYYKDREVHEVMTREQMLFVRPSFAEFILDTYNDPDA
jgi:hypothetical protein